MTNSYYFSKHWRALRAACLARDHNLCVVCGEYGNIADHIETRAPVPYPTPLDRLDNLRTLCATHDSQVKESAAGVRRNGGEFRVMGCDDDGWPLDPSRR